jgi:predicted RNase H-like nuclease
VLDDDAEPSSGFGKDIAELTAWAGDVAAIGIDIPIHLNDDRDRACDTAARRALSPHGSRVFNAPVSAVLWCSTYVDANEASHRLLGKKISKQTWNLVPKIAEVDEWLPLALCPVYEVHPELAFGAMNGAIVAASKKSREGAAARERLLADHGIGVPGEVRRTDDLLDACAVAWSIRRIANGGGVCLPPDPPIVGGCQQAVWY